MEKRETFQGFEFLWQEPPTTTAGWQISIAGTTQELMAALVKATEKHGSHIVTGRDLDDALAQAKAFVAGISL